MCLFPNGANVPEGKVDVKFVLVWKLVNNVCKQNNMDRKTWNVIKLKSEKENKSRSREMQRGTNRSSWIND